MSVAAIGLHYRTVNIQVVTGLFLEILNGLDGIAEVRGRDTIVPGLAGRVVRNRIADRWSIELVGFVRGVSTTEATDRSAFRTNVQAMRALFDSTLAPGPLVAALEDGHTATIQARTLNIISTLDLPSYRSLSIELESVDAGWVIT